MKNIICTLIAFLLLTAPLLSAKARDLTIEENKISAEEFQDTYGPTLALNKSIEEAVARAMTFWFNNLDNVMKENKVHFTLEGWLSYQRETANFQQYIKRTYGVATATVYAKLINTGQQTLYVDLTIQNGSKIYLSYIDVEIKISESKEKESFQITDWKITPRQSVDFLTLK